jgi:hypothetical protein
MAEQMLREHVVCRAFRHAWDTAAPDLRFKNRPNSLSQDARCERCGSIRHQWLDWQGIPMATWYDLEEEYAKVAVAMSPGDAKLWLINEKKPARRRRLA